MSITIGTQPEQIAAAYNENIWKVTSDRDDAIIKAASAVADDGGFAKYTVGGSHGFLVGDVITGTVFGESVYNVIQTITAISGTTVTTDIVFIGDTAGTLTRNNNNFQIKAQVIEFGVIGGKAISATADAGGGLINFTTSGNHNLIVGDFIIVTGTTSYNDLFKVVAIPSDTVVSVAATFVANETGVLEEGIEVGSKTSKIDIDGINYRFNFQNILSSIVNDDGFDLLALGSTTLQTPTNNSIRSYGIFFTEQFDDAEGLQKDGDIKTTPVVKKTVNVARQLGEALILDEFLTDGVTRRFLTSSTNPKDIQDSQEEQLSFIADDGSTYKISSEKFDASGASLGVTLTGVVPITNNRGIIPVNNNMWDAATFTLDVWLTDGSNVQVSEKRKFKIERSCFRNQVEVYFLNRSGGHDLYTFTGDLKEAIEVSKTRFKKVVPDGFDIEERSQTTLGVTANDKVEIFSQFLTKAEGVWLAEYVSSPEVVLLEDSNFVPIDPLSKKVTINDDKGLTQIKAIFNKPDLIIQTN